MEFYSLSPQSSSLGPLSESEAVSPPPQPAQFPPLKTPSFLDTLELNGVNQQNQGVAEPVFDTEDDLKKRLLRYGKAKKRGLEFARYLDGVDRRDLAFPLHACGEFLTFHDYFTVNKLRLVKANFCNKHLLCAFCAIRRGAKHLRAYLERFEVIRKNNPGLKLELITLTVKNGDDLQERFHHLSNGLRVFRKRASNFKRGKGCSVWGEVLGSVGAYEVTNKGRGWHPHLHIIALSKNGVDKGRLRDEWKEITGDSFEVDVRPLDENGDPSKDFIEVFKYSVAFSDLTFEQNLIAHDVFKGRNLLFSQGLFRGVPMPEKLTDDPLKDLPYVVLMYRYLEGMGYQLKRNDLIEKEGN